jgi:hypothetical protein
MTMWEKIKAEAKAKWVIGFLVGAVLSALTGMLFYIPIPKGNETQFATLSGALIMAWGAFINHVMKTTDKEKLNDKNN